VRIRSSLAPALVVPLTLTLFGCSSVKAEKGPFLDDDPVGGGGPSGNSTGTGTTTTGNPGAGSTGTGMGTGGAGAGGPGAGGAGAGGGGTSPGTGSCQTFDYKNYQAPAGNLTLKTDILPIFLAPTSSCVLSVCHSDRSANAPKLGPSNGMVDAAGLEAIRNALLAPSLQVPSLRFVVPGKPEESYLMNKLDGTFGCMGFACQTSAGCGERMPQLLDPLDADKINKVRAWIKQGAAAM
jgi:hypothetical protein